MAGIMQVGSVARSGEDVLPTTGPHLDVRVLKDGQYINPATWRSGLQRLKIGQSRTPLYSQNQGQWSAAFPVTSGFGPRSAPTAGASTDHKGIDYGVAGGEQLYWEGPGTFKPGQGYGSITTPEGYEVRLLHTKGGKETQLAGALTTESQQQQPAPTQRTDLQPITIIDLRGKKKEPKDFLTSYRDQLMANALGLGTESSSSSSLMDPMKMAMSVMNQQPVNYFG